MPEKKMHKEEEKMQEKNTITNNGVVISVYVESLRTRSKKITEDHNKKTKPSPMFKVPHDAAGGRAQGYDRRAQLLAYSRQLRNKGSIQKVDDSQLHQIQLSRKESQSPHNRSKKSYEHLEEESSNLIKGVKRSKKRKGSGKNLCYPFLRRLKNMLKKLSCKNW